MEGQERFITNSPLPLDENEVIPDTRKGHHTRLTGALTSQRQWLTKHGHLPGTHRGSTVQTAGASDRTRSAQRRGQGSSEMLQKASKGPDLSGSNSVSPPLTPGLW